MRLRHFHHDIQGIIWAYVQGPILSFHRLILSMFNPEIARP
jgi:hypothetical protein